MGGQAARGAILFALLFAFGLLGACGPKTGAGERQTPSGLPVPRYVSLKFDPINARAGPSDDHRLLWQYHAKNLPVQVIAETADWRRICDPDGSVSWVHRRTTDGRRTVIRLEPTPLALLAQPKDGAGVVAYLAPRAIAMFDKCQKDWCRLKIDRASGWVPQAAVWGAAETPQCSKPK
jgi:SH3-like domain-containing protein